MVSSCSSQRWDQIKLCMMVKCRQNQKNTTKRRSVLTDQHRNIFMSVAEIVPFVFTWWVPVGGRRGANYWCGFPICLWSSDGDQKHHGENLEVKQIMIQWNTYVCMCEHVCELPSQGYSSIVEITGAQEHGEPDLRQDEKLIISVIKNSAYVVRQWNCFSSECAGIPLRDAPEESAWEKAWKNCEVKEKESLGHEGGTEGEVRSDETAPHS